MNQLGNRRHKNAQHIRRAQKQALFAQMRQLLLQAESLSLETVWDLGSDAGLMHLAYKALDQGSQDALTVYVNIRRILSGVMCIERRNTWEERMAVWLYVVLGSFCEVVSWMAECEPVQEWQMMLCLRQQYGQVWEPLYEIMSNFLMELQSQHRNQTKEIDQSTTESIMQKVLSEQSTQILSSAPFPIESESNFYSLLNQYYSMVPHSHLNKLINSGYVNLSMMAPNRSVYTMLLSHIQEQADKDQEMQQLLEEFEALSCSI